MVFSSPVVGAGPTKWTVVESLTGLPGTPSSGRVKPAHSEKMSIFGLFGSDCAEDFVALEKVRGCFQHRLATYDNAGRLLRSTDCETTERRIVKCAVSPQLKYGAYSDGGNLRQVNLLTGQWQEHRLRSTVLQVDDAGNVFCQNGERSEPSPSDPWPKNIVSASPGLKWCLCRPERGKSSTVTCAGKVVLKLKNEGFAVVATAWSEDRLAVSEAGGPLWVVDLQEPRVIARIDPGADFQFNNVGFAPDRQVVALAINTGNGLTSEIRTFRGEKEVNGVFLPVAPLFTAFVNGGKYLACGTRVIYDCATGDPVAEF
jgi:hypothetical protein